jgi:hypothetical protein
LFAALAVQVHGGLPVQQYVTDLQAGELGDAGAGVVGGGEQDRVNPLEPWRLGVVVLSEWLVLWCPRPWVGRLGLPAFSA